MNRLRQVWGIGLMVFCFFQCNPSQAQAKSYTISEVVIESRVNPDGSMQVTERRTYDFTGDYTFAYQTISDTPDQSKEPGRTEAYRFSGFSLCEEADCYRQLTETEKATADENKPAGTFYVTKTDDGYYVKWFYDASNEQKTFSLLYSVDNAVTRHADTAELYWQWIGNKWEIPQQNISATVIVPPGIGDQDIKAYAHGPVSGRVSIPSNRNVVFTLDRLQGGTFFEGRILMPREVFSGGAAGTLSKTAIEAQEQQFIEDTIRSARQSVYFQGGLSLIAIGLFIYTGILLTKQILSFWRYGKDVRLPTVSLSGRIWEPPSDIDPAQVEQLLSGLKTLSTKSFTATVLSLVHKRYYRLKRSDQKEGFIFKKYQYYLVPEEATDGMTMSSIQKATVNLLDAVGIEPVTLEGKQTMTIPLQSIIDWCKTNRATA